MSNPTETKTRQNNPPEQKTPPEQEGSRAAEREAAKEQRKQARLEKRLLNRRKHRKIRKILIWAFLLLAIGGFFLWRYAFQKARPAAETPYRTYSVERRDISVVLSAPGTVQPVNSYSLSTLVRGEILEAPFSEGDMIEQGALLFRINSSSVETSIEKAQFNLEKAQLSYDDLVESLRDLTIKSDYAGIVQELYVEQGDTIGAGQKIARILDSETMLIDISFFAADAGQFSRGDRAIVTVESTLEELSGTVRDISPIQTVNENNAPVKTVTISVKNPGGLTETDVATARVENTACYKGGSFYYHVNEVITSKAAGEIVTLNLKEGRQLHQGDLVLELENKALNTQIKSSLLSLKEAQSSLNNAYDQLDDYHISSPISGTVVAKNYEAGEVIDSASGNSAMAVIYDMSALTFVMNIDELDIGSIALGQQVNITSEALKSERYTGLVSKISIQGSTSGGITTYPVTVTVNEVGNLLPGMNIDAEIVVRQARNVLAVPVDAVSRGNRVKLLVDDSAGSSGQGIAAEQAKDTPDASPAAKGNPATPSATEEDPVNRIVTEETPPSFFSAEDAFDAPSGGAAGESGTARSGSGARTRGMTQTFSGDNAPFDGSAGGAARRETAQDGGSAQTVPENAGASDRVQDGSDTPRAEVQTYANGMKYIEISVQLGVDDGQYIEVLSGLSEGDVVIIETVAVPSSSSMGFMMGGMSGGRTVSPGGGMGGGTALTYGGGGETFRGAGGNFSATPNRAAR